MLKVARPHSPSRYPERPHGYCHGFSQKRIPNDPVAAGERRLRTLLNRWALLPNATRGVVSAASGTVSRRLGGRIRAVRQDAEFEQTRHTLSTGEAYLQSGRVYAGPNIRVPYRAGRTEDVEKGLCLMRFHVPGWALAPVFGCDVLYGYRWEQGLGRFSVVGTTVKEAERWAHDWVADEKQSRLEGRTDRHRHPRRRGVQSRGLGQRLGVRGGGASR